MRRVPFRLAACGFLAAATLLPAGSLPARGEDSGSPVLPANVERVESYGGITQYRLRSNDMTILLAPNHAAPVFTFLVVYHVGSRNEAPGNTGSAHLLEHLLFNKSTENFGRANGHETFQEVLYQAGADFSSTNMTTWNDRMTGYSTLPKDKLDLAMRIEADRLGRGLLLDSERQPEMSVVRNEYEIGENDPSQALWKSLIGAAIVAHPYHWDTIGYRSDIEGVSTAKLREHYDTYFHPDNAEAVLVGDFDPAAALALFDKEFGGFPHSTKPIPKVITVEPPQEGERRVTVSRPGQVGIVQLAYIRPGSLDPDFIPLDVLNGILTDGVNSRLHQALVETGLATSVTGTNFTFRDPYPIVFEAYVAPGHTQREVEDALKSALYRVGKEGVTAVELERAQKQLEVSVIRSRDGTYGLASALGEAVASANWKWFLAYVDNMKAVTAADVQRVAATYLVPEHATVGWFVPESPAAAEKAEAAAKAAPAGKRTQSLPQNPSVSLAAAAAGSGGTFAQQTLHRELSNGIILDVIENHAAPTVAVSGVLLAGNMTAPADNPAVPALTAMMVQRGTTSRTKNEIGALLDGAGASLSLDQGLQQTTITGSALSRDADLLVDILADEIMNPAFPDSELAKAKLEYRNQVGRNAENTTLRADQRLSEAVFPEGHPYRQPTTDARLAATDAATVDMIRDFHRLRYNGSSLMLAVAGDVDAQAIAKRVEAAFGGLPKGTRPEFNQSPTAPGRAGREVVTMPGKANMNFMFGQASGLRRTDPDYEAALIANAALGQTSLSSRIGRRVRDTEGLSYSLYSRFFYSDFLDGVWRVNVAVAPQNLKKALASTREEIEKYCRDGITPEEVEVQKSFFAGNYQVHLASNAGVAAALTDAEKFGYGPSYLDTFPQRIRAVTREQVNAAIHAHLDPSKMILVVAGDLTEIP